VHERQEASLHVLPAETAIPVPLSDESLFGNELHEAEEEEGHTTAVYLIDVETPNTTFKKGSTNQDNRLYILQLAATAVVGGETFSSYCQPPPGWDRHANPYSMAQNNISAQTLAQAKPFSAVWADFLSFIAMHNIHTPIFFAHSTQDFDLKALQGELVFV
jgi:hypothetical protein